ncbi:MAG TPA: sigma-70 family RNA polymerase sigma factor [Pseudonocardiaceae bacterium]|jgi:RNA polymerase sigma-70 factor (ECF subfamily)|nr:sigma-70 family RNA polymerase sigma factor [Pseudonocardiaceae bacterium]
MPTDVIDSDVDADFVALADPYRRELYAHCYRMLGSVHDAEDLVQETYLRAWRGYQKFEGRSSLRTWLHRIATTACLTALEGRGRRPLPTGLGASSSDPTAELVERQEIPWLEPIPRSMVDHPADPASIAESRAGIRLALIAALQHLPPRQRAVLILCEVLKWRAAEVATALDTTTASVNSLLQRARAQLDKLAPAQEEVAEPTDAVRRAMLDRYVDAFQDYDLAALSEMFTENAVWEMPPFTGWYQGPAAIRSLIEHNCPAKHPRDLMMTRTEANGQVAGAQYLLDNDTGEHTAFSLHVLTFDADRIAHVTVFFDLSLFEVFGLPRVWRG